MNRNRCGAALLLLSAVSLPLLMLGLGTSSRTVAAPQVDSAKPPPQYERETAAAYNTTGELLRPQTIGNGYLWEHR
jgi:hypothetical protein